MHATEHDRATVQAALARLSRRCRDNPVEESLVIASPHLTTTEATQ